MDIPAPHSNRFADIRATLDANDCQCRGFRRTNRKFKDAEQLDLAYMILTGDHHHVIDPLIVREGDEYLMTVEEYEALCFKPANLSLSHLKLYRAAVAFDLSSVSSEHPVPIDPYDLGFWLGDGTAEQPIIASSDPKLEVWLQSYVDRLNSIRPAGARALYLTKHHNDIAGEVKNGYVTRVDVFIYRISCPRGGPGYWANPVWDGLRNLGLLGDKSGGIPQAYMEADEDIRLAVIAGLIDSDGTLSRQNQYVFMQSTEGHKNIVYTMKELALSCGTAVTGVYEGLKRPAPGRISAPSPYYTIILVAVCRR